jgi:RNA polymerase sigma-70 factor, ECF subfamily
VDDLSPDERRLVTFMVGYQKGNMDDFTALYSELEQPLRRYLWTFVRDGSTIDDLLQTTFMQIHRARASYMPPRPIKPWVYAITRHVALMHLRSHRRRKEDTPAENLPEVPIPPAVELLGDRTLARRLLAELPRPSQEVLILHHMLGLSFEEVGRVMGTSAGAAKVRAHRALKVLREQLADTGGVS